MENQPPKRKIEGAYNPNIQTKTPAYSKEYYTLFFSIMISLFFILYWLCFFTKLKEFFQVVTMTALSIAVAEYISRQYLKYKQKK